MLLGDRNKEPGFTTAWSVPIQFSSALRVVGDGDSTMLAAEDKALLFTQAHPAAFGKVFLWHAAAHL